jgi:hypothetical protein
MYKIKHTDYKNYLQTLHQKNKYKHLYKIVNLKDLPVVNLACILIQNGDLTPEKVTAGSGKKLIWHLLGL